MKLFPYFLPLPLLKRAVLIEQRDDGQPEWDQGETVRKWWQAIGLHFKILEVNDGTEIRC